MSISYLDITVCRKDESPITADELERFTDYFFGGFGVFKSDFDIAVPYVHAGQIFATCSWRGGYDRCAMMLFASENPHLQIEIMEEFIDGDCSYFRHLYEDDLYEVCNEIRSTRKQAEAFADELDQLFRAYGM